MQSTNSNFLSFLHAFVHGNVSFITFPLTQRLTSSDKKIFLTKSVNVLSASCYTMMSYLLSETLCGPAWPELVTRVTITCVAWHQVCSGSGQASLMGESVGGGKHSISTLDCVCRSRGQCARHCLTGSQWGSAQVSLAQPCSNYPDFCPGREQHKPTLALNNYYYKALKCF